MKLHTSLLLAAPAFALSTPALAQFPDTRSSSSVIPAGVSYDGPTRGVLDERTRIAPAQTAPVVQIQDFSTTTHPISASFELTDLFSAQVAPYVEIDAHCLGMAQLPPLDESGVPLIAQNDRWASVTVSVSNESMGLPGSVTRRRRDLTSGRNTPGADLVTYYLAGSAGLDPSIPKVAFPSRLAEDVALGGASTTISFDALDFGMGVLAESPAGVDPIFFPFDPPVFFFSVTPASAADINLATTSFAVDDGSPVEADPATIYRIGWDPAQQTWDPVIEVYADPVELALTGEDEDVDGISIDLDNGAIVYSTQIATGRSQLLIARKEANGSVTTFGAFRDEAGPVTTSLGVRDDVAAAPVERDDIRSICIIEPEADDVGRYLAVNRDHMMLQGLEPVPLGISVTKVHGVAAQKTLVINVSGPPGYQGGAVVLYTCAHYDESLPWDQSTWEQLGVFGWNQGDGVFTHTVTVPSSVIVPKFGVAAIHLGAPTVQPRGTYTAQIEL